MFLKGYLFCCSWNWDEIPGNACLLGVKNCLKDHLCLIKITHLKKVITDKQNSISLKIC